MLGRRCDLAFSELLRATYATRCDGTFDLVWYRVLTKASGWARRQTKRTSPPAELLPLQKLGLASVAWTCRTLWGKLLIGDVVPRALWHYRSDLGAVDRALSFYRRHASLMLLVALKDANLLFRVQKGFRTRAAQELSQTSWLRNSTDDLYGCLEDGKGRPEEPRFGVRVLSEAKELIVSYDPVLPGLGVLEMNEQAWGGEQIDIGERHVYQDVTLWQLLIKLSTARGGARKGLADKVWLRANPPSPIDASFQSFLTQFPNYLEEHEKWDEETARFFDILRTSFAEYLRTR